MPNPNPPDPNAAPPNVCGVCGTALAPGRLGAQCPRCLLSLGSSFGLPGDDAAEEGLLDPMQVRGFGDFELLEEIARGGMGIVYRARQISLNREVAIKMILAGELAGKDALRLFQREAHAAANLHHPNIVPVYEIGEHAMQHYFTMRFVPGGKTIADWAVTRRGEWRAIAETAAKVARAVAYAHAHGVLHRDLKPSNILWDADDGPQVTDFGLAKLLNESDGTATRAAQVIGSPSYMAPEQMGGRMAEITTATDVYGLGAVLYELLSGKPPFSGASAIETMRRAAESAPAPLPDVPNDLRTICLKCLAKKQEDRYLSAAALAEDLERFVRGEPVSAVPLTTLQTLWRWALRKPALAAMLALFITSLIVGLAGITWQWRKTERARAEQAKALAHLQWQEIGHWLDEGESSRALAYLASLIRERPDRWQAVMYAMSIAEQHSSPLLAGPEIHPPVKLTGSACLAPDGSWVAAAGEDQIVRIWDVASGKEAAQFSHASPVTSLAVAGGPVKIAVATQDGALTTRADIAAPPLALPRADATPVLELRFSADGSHLLARAKERVEVWRTGALDQPPLRIALPEEIKGTDVSADGSRVLVWGTKHAAIWDTSTAAEVLHVQVEKRIQRGAIAGNGKRVSLLDGGSFARTWDVASGQPLKDIRSRFVQFAYLALDHSGTRLTLAGSTNDLSVHDVESGLPVSPPMRHHYFVIGLRSSPDGTRAISHGWDDTVRVWDAQTGRPAMSPIAFSGARKSYHVASSQDGRIVLVHLPPEHGLPESISVWRGSHTGEPQQRTVEGQRAFDGTRISPDGRLGALGLLPGNRCYVYELATGKVLLDEVTEGSVYVHLFSPDMRRCYALTANGWLYGWSLETGQPLWKPNHQPGFIRPAAISPDGTRIIAGHNDGHIRIYDTATGELVQTLDHPGEVKVLRFAPDRSGRFLSASTDTLAHVWDLATGRKLQTFTGHNHTIIAGSWSPDSRFVATASYDTTARVWDVASGRTVGAPMQHLAWLSHLEFSPDGTRLATACRDGTARLWHPFTGQPASPPLVQGSSGETVRFTADGRAFLVRDHDGFRFWDTEKAEPVTAYYSEPSSGGVGMDSENWRAIMTADGTRVFLGTGMNHGALWSIPQPRATAPAWLPGFLEMLAQMRIDERGEIRLIERTWRPGFLGKIEQAAPDDGYAAWARKILGGAGR